VFLAFTPTARATENPLEQKVTKFKLDQLPPAVRATVEKESAGGKVEEIEKETENGKTFYDVEIEKNGTKAPCTSPRTERSSRATPRTKTRDEDDGRGRGVRRSASTTGHALVALPRFAASVSRYPGSGLAVRVEHQV